jgi:hypothetical protein
MLRIGLPPLATGRAASRACTICGDPSLNAYSDNTDLLGDDLGPSFRQQQVRLVPVKLDEVTGAIARQTDPINLFSEFLGKTHHKCGTA